MFALLCFCFSVLSQEIGWEECLRNDLFCVGWDVKPRLNQSALVRVIWLLYYSHVGTEVLKC